MTYEGFLKSGIIEDEIMKRNWTLNDVLDMDKTVDEIVQGLIVDMDIETKYLIVKDIQVEAAIIDSFPVGEIISKVLRQELTDMVSFVVSNYLKPAKEEFDDNNNTNRIDKENDNRIEEVVEPIQENVSQDEKIVTLKERIRNDAKRLDEKEMRKQGMI